MRMRTALAAGLGLVVMTAVCAASPAPAAGTGVELPSTTQWGMERVWQNTEAGGPEAVRDACSVWRQWPDYVTEYCVERFRQQSRFEADPKDIHEFMEGVCAA